MRFFPTLFLIFTAPLFALNLATQEWPPYQVENDGIPSGISFQYIRCIEKELKEKINVAFFPWMRAQALVHSGEFDGFFAASQSDLRDKFLVFSHAFIPQDWSFFYLFDPSKKGPYSVDDIKKNLRVGVRKTANLAYWLKKEGFQLEAPNDDLPLLIQMLERKNIDVIAENDTVFKHFSSKKYQRTFYMKHPLGVYFGKKYLQKNPDMLSRFNRAADTCSLTLTNQK